MNGTDNMTKGPAMPREKTIEAIEIGIQTIFDLKEKGYGLFATGEMGIGNTTTSSAIASVFLEVPPETVTGRGAGLSDAGLERKIHAIQRAIEVNCPDKEDAIDVMSKVGGLDIAGLTGCFIGAAAAGLPIVIDGFISSVAALCAVKIAPLSVHYMFPSHVSAEPAGNLVLEYLGMKALLHAGYVPWGRQRRRCPALSFLMRRWRPMKSCRHLKRAMWRPISRLYSDRREKLKYRGNE